MKTNDLSPKIIAISLTALLCLLLIRTAAAQDILLAQSSSLNSQNQNNIPQLILNKPKKRFHEELRQKTSFTYYHQFLGPTLKGRTSETYNVFLEGRAPLQSFHAFNLRYQATDSYGFGASLSAVKGYTPKVITKEGFINGPEDQFFNARFSFFAPMLDLKYLNLFTTLSYEAPTSVISRENNMKFGWVVTETFAAKSTSPRLSYGLNLQVYKVYYDKNILPPPFIGGKEVKLQNMIINLGPYLNYKVTDKLTLGSTVTLDWDQKGHQEGTLNFNNNLPHRGRMSLTYYPTDIPYLSSVGVFTQALLKFRPETTAIGFDFSLRI